ncbi:MAG: DUF4340 domain-containing protein [Pirellulales bacterium]|nr:DUF4340 domain-containing protein [Pirellulales bacterium]
MPELLRTSTFVAIGLVLLAVGYATLPAPPRVDQASKIGQPLFPECKPDKAASLEVVTFDERQGKRDEFKVERVNDKWTLPSKDNYPADGKERLYAAATSLVNLEPLRLASENPKQHAEFGVLDPATDSAKLQEQLALYKTAAGKAANSKDANAKDAKAALSPAKSPTDPAVGKLVVIRDAGNKPLAQIILGNKVQDVAGKTPNPLDFTAQQTTQRYVRIQDEDPVYVVDLKSDEFTTNFVDWIETDLLKFGDGKLANVELQDYNYTIKRIPYQGVTLLQPERAAKSTIVLDLPDAQADWKIRSATEYTDGKPQEIKLAEDQELNTAKAGDLKSALRNLQIIDVKRKPQELINILQSKDITQINEVEHAAVAEDMAILGFYLIPNEQNRLELGGKDGEVIARLQNGVEYILRFGESRTEGTGAATNAGAEGNPLASNTTRQRLIMVSTRFNPDLIKKPELEPIPPKPGEQPAEPAPMTDTPAVPPAEKTSPQPPADAPATATDDKPAAAPAADNTQEKPATEKTPATEPAPAQPKSQEAKQDQQAVAPRRLRLQPVKFQAESAAQPKTETPAADKAETDTTTEKSPPATTTAAPPDTEKAPATTGPATTAPAPVPAATTEPAKTTSAEAEQLWELQRKQVEARNAEKLKKYNEELQAGRNLAKQLNDRFAQWYYVISDDVYKQIHLTKDDLIQMKGMNAADGSAPPGFGGADGLNGISPPPGLNPEILRQLQEGLQKGN